MKVSNIISKLDIKRHCITLTLDNLQCVNIPELNFKSPYSIRDFQYTEKDYQSWCYIVNHAYNEEQYDIEHAQSLLRNHPMFDNLETVFLCKGSTPIGTISFGQYKGDASLGGCCRFAVLPSEQGNRFGKSIIIFAIKRLKERGYIGIKESIASKRKISMFIHFGFGFKPLYVSSIQLKYGWKKMIVSLWFNCRLNKICKKFYIEYKRNNI